MVYLTLCLFCLSSFGALCSSFDDTNCALYNCVVDTVPGKPDQYRCVDDVCYAKNKSDGVCDAVSSTACKLVTYTVNNTAKVPVCISEQNHFSDCRLTTEALDTLYKAGDEDDFTPLENYCAKLGCGGLYMFFDKNDDIYFRCEEPNSDGTVAPDDFDTNNCKHFEYKVVGNKCDYDPCTSHPGDGVDCADDANCAELTSGDSTLCLGKDQSECKVASWNLGAISSSDDCAKRGCGGLDIARSKNGNVYVFCKPSEAAVNSTCSDACAECPERNSASYTHICIFIVLVTAMFAFL